MSVNSIQIGGTHYKEMDIQPWDAMKAWMPKEAFEGYLRGAAIKYLARYDRKGGVEDVRKARHYLDALIESMDGAKHQAPAKAPIRAPETFSEPVQYITRRDVPKTSGGVV